VSESGIYTYAFGSDANAVSRHRLRWKGRPCRVVARGGLNTVMVEFLDNGERLTCSRNAIRRKKGAK